MDEPPGHSEIITSALSQSANIWLSLIGLALLCLFWLLIATVDAAMYTLSANELTRFSQRKSFRDSAMAWLMNYPQHLQIANLIFRWGIKISLVTIGVIEFRRYEPSTLLVFIFASLVCLLILIGEMLAKTLALRQGPRVASNAAPLFVLLTILLMPFTHLALALMKGFVKFLGDRAKASERAAARVLNEVLAEGQSEERELSKPMVNFGAVTVRQLMRPRKEIQAVDVGKDFSEVIEQINQTKFSRLPVYRSTLDKIEGILYIKDLIPFLDQQRGFEWQKLIRPVTFTTESTRLPVMLKEFQQKHVHLAMVVDKYGRIAGLITLLDLIEEVIGDINEEFNTMNPTH